MGISMTSDTRIFYHDYIITITEVAGRFVPRVTRESGLIEHDGQVSEVWAPASCYSADRAAQVAKAAIDNGRVR